MSRPLWLLVIVAACGSNTHELPPDAATPDAPIDAPTSYAACREFSDLATSMPVHHEGMLDGADLESPHSCAQTNAPYGINSAGPDAVTYISGLVPEMPYVVHVSSPADLAFYVVTGCDTPSGPSAAECVLFEDASTGTDEVGTFIAPGSHVYVVVDYYASHAPSDLAYTLDVYPLACTTNAQCSGGTPVCEDGECVECSTSFDCTNPDKPRCDRDEHRCEVGIDQCSSDDAAEPNDDGPAGATLLVPDGDGNCQRSATICSAPPSERDYYAFDVTTLGETWDISLAWAGTHDLDLEVVSATGEQYALSYWEHPEHVRLTYLPLGRYYVRVDEFSSSPDPTPVSYNVTAHRTLGTGCQQASDCATEFRNQIFRGNCDAGACVPIDGNNAVAEGGSCDSQSDCASGLNCPSFYFVADAATRDVCAPSCASDADCSGLGADYTCTTYLQHNFCVQKCQTDLECPTVVGSQPQIGPWYRLSCQQSTGRCLP